MKFFSPLFLTSLTCSISLVQAKALWASTPSSSDVLTQAYPMGNGRLGAMPFGAPGAEKIVLNIDSLWSGGPFESSSYTGGNPASEEYKYLPGIRKSIFQNGTGNVDPLLGNNNDYGSFQVYANLSVTIGGVTFRTAYNRSLDLNTGVHTTVFTANDGNTYTSTVYCSYPDQVCVYNLSSTGALPAITIALENQKADHSLYNATCGDQYVRLTGVTQLGPPTGMKYDGIARLTTRTGTASCSKTIAGALVIPASSHIRTFSVVIGANTDYDQTAGTAATNFSFKGADPGSYVESVTSAAASKAESDIRQSHIADYQSLASQFTLSLPDTAKSAGLETSAMIGRYSSSGSGDPYLESTLFELGRHLFISSTRDNSLPPNLQGRWSPDIEAAWGADYHADINMQMNHWGVDQTGLGNLQVATWDFMQNTWVPRGTQTAQLLYNAEGWVCHDEMNIFGHTGMKYSAQWADYPAAPAWMMQHVYDHFSYSQNVTWLQQQGYPLMKGVAQFWLTQLQPDHFFNDGSLVVNPCNSPEHAPTTFACTHYQQLIHQLFSTVLSTSSIVSDTDKGFIANVTTALKTLDKGLHIGSWGEVKEWKIPDSYGYDFENDTHRHLSNLIGWYPGYSLSSFLSGYENKTIQSAVATTLYSRGPGNGPDANAGWEKVWRSACWARLNNTSEAYFEMKYTIEQNIAGNGFSMYNGHGEPFQIDANFGFVGAALSFLVVDNPLENGSEEGRVVVLGPAIPTSWSPGEVSGLRLRGGGTVDFQWDATGTVTSAHVTGRTASIILVNKAGKVL